MRPSLDSSHGSNKSKVACLETASMCVRMLGEWMVTMDIDSMLVGALPILKQWEWHA